VFINEISLEEFQRNYNNIKTNYIKNNTANFWDNHNIKKTNLSKMDISKKTGDEVKGKSLFFILLFHIISL
jgi:hypothetical protein